MFINNYLQTGKTKKTLPLTELSKQDQAVSSAKDRQMLLNAGVADSIDITIHEQIQTPIQAPIWVWVQVGIPSKGKEHRQLLIVAAESCPLDTVQFVVKQGMAVNAKDGKGETALHKVAWLGRDDIVQYLLICQDIDINAKNALSGYTALHFAAMQNHLKITRLLLAHPNIDPNEQNYSGNTPLMTACQFGGSGRVAAVLLHTPDINVNTQDINGKTALYKASRNGKLSIVYDLLKNKETLINMCDHFGKTALYRAAEEGHVKVVQLLLRYQANPQIKNNKGDRATDVAKEKGHQNIVQLLEEQPISILEKLWEANAISYFNQIPANIITLISCFLAFQAQEITTNEEEYAAVKLQLG